MPRYMVLTDTAANFTSANPVLLAKLVGMESNTGKYKIGDGVTAWNSLAYAIVAYTVGGTDVALADGGTGASTAAGARTNLDVPSNAEAVLDTLFDANTVLAADSDNTPAALTMGASTILARLAAGNIKAATPAELRTLLDVPTTGEAILDTLVDAKGDLIAATAADTVARVAVGANDTVLTADSAQAAGVKWAAPSGVLLGGKVVGAYYTTMTPSTEAWQVTAGHAVNVLTAMPIWLKAGTLDRISQQHLGSTVVGETARMGIYLDSGFGSPGALLLDAGTIDLSTAAGIKEITISQAVTDGLYWLALVKQGSSTATIIGANFTVAGKPIMPTKAPAGTNLYDLCTAFTKASVTGALPNPFASTVASVNGGARTTPPFIRYSA